MIKISKSINQKLNFIIIFLIILTSSNVFAKKQVVDSDQETTQVRQPYKEADNGIDMRKSRRLGIGLQAAGALGFGGAIIDLNFNPHWSFSTGFGGGEGFQAFKFEGKYVLTGDWLMPYFAFGYANWSSIGKTGQITKTNPAILGDKLLSGDDKAAGEYRKNLIYPAFGLQFMQLTGDYAGFSIFGEFTALIDIGGFVSAPTGTLGFLYYF